MAPEINLSEKMYETKNIRFLMLNKEIWSIEKKYKKIDTPPPVLQRDMSICFVRTLRFEKLFNLNETNAHNNISQGEGGGRNHFCRKPNANFRKLRFQIASATIFLVFFSCVSSFNNKMHLFKLLCSRNSKNTFFRSILNLIRE